MDVGKKFFRILEGSRKKQVLFFCVSMAVIFSLYFPAMQMLRVAREKAHIIALEVGNDFKIGSNINSVEENGKLNFVGWITRPDSKNIDVTVVLEEDSGTDIKIISTKSFNSDEVKEKFNMDGKNGFRASIETNALDENVCYEIQFALNYVESGMAEGIEQSKKIFSGKYLFNKEIYNYNPTDYKAPQINDETLASAIVAGNIKYHDAKSGCWVYEKENKLYFVLNDNFKVKNDGTHRIKFHVHTMQTELLPLERQQYGFESKDFFFHEKEVVLAGTSEYRVAVLELPTEYEISWIELGLYEVEGAMLKNMPFLFEDEAK